MRRPRDRQRAVVRKRYARPRFPAQVCFLSIGGQRFVPMDRRWRVVASDLRPSPVLTGRSRLDRGPRRGKRPHIHHHHPQKTDVFRRIDGTLRDHIILEGRHPDERVASVATFSGSAFYLSSHFQPLLVLGPEAYGITYLRENLGSLPREALPRYDLARWAQAATRHLGEGRVAILGEASMCTAQQDEYGPFGMNHPDAASNAQFCVNLVRWLSGVLVDPTVSDADRLR